MMLVEQPDHSKLLAELEYYRKRCYMLEAENKQLKGELQSLKVTLSAVVAARSIVDARPVKKKKTQQKAG